MRTNVASFAVALLLAPGIVAADSIYLKNGRVITTDSAEVREDRVLFTRYGHPFSIPLTQVDRIVDDDESGPTARPVTPTEPSSSDPARRRGDAPAGSEAPATEAAAEDSRMNRDYWQARVRAIEAESTTLRLEYEELRRIERAFLFSHRSTSDTRAKIEAVQARMDANERAFPELRREARRLGVPAGWLRLP